MKFKCNKCSSIDFFIQKSSNNTGLYCKECGKWQRWLSKDELRAFEYSMKKENLKSEDVDIPIGRLCCFKPIDQNAIYFGHMAGKVVDEFENMSYMYVLKCDDRYFFSRKAIIKPDDVHTSNEAKKYFSDK